MNIRKGFAAGAVVLALATWSRAASITIVSENFDGIGTSATATLPGTFRADALASGAANVRKVGTYAAAGNHTGLAGGNNLATNATNGIYNFGAGPAATATDRAVGFLSSSTATASGNLYFKFTAGPTDLLSLDIAYDVEKYRDGSNVNGFRVQLFYSTDGTAWISAGSSFNTPFAADLDNNGFAAAPGATSAVSATLTVPVAANTDFYLAWNYSVAATSTVTSAQALALDDISINATTADAAPAPLPTAAETGLALFAGFGVITAATHRRRRRLAPARK